MDARKYSYQPIQQPGYENMVQLVPGYDAKVKKMMSDSTADHDFPIIGTVWATDVFNRREVANNSYQTWKIGYEYICRNEGKFHYMTSPGIMATIGLRDFEEQLTPVESKWCQQILLSYGAGAMKPKDYMNFSFVTDQKEAMTGLSLLFVADLSKEIETSSKEMIFRLLISNIEEQEKIYLAHGVSNYLVKSQPDFLRDCWFGLLAYITELDDRGTLSEREGNYFDQNVKSNGSPDSDWNEGLVNAVVSGSINPPDPIDPVLNMTTYRELNDALRIIPTDTTLQLQHDFIQLLLKRHIDFLNDRNHRHRYDYYESRRAFTFFYARFLLAQPQDLAEKYFVELLSLTTLDESPTYTDELTEFLYGIVQEHIRAVNDGSSVTNFWRLWELLKEWIIVQKNGFLMPLLLLEIDWNDTTVKWHVLERKKLFYKDFILDFGFNQINKTMKFLTVISFYNFMPDSISWVSEMLTTKEANSIDRDLGDRFIQKAFYNFGNEIKNNKQVLNNFIFILDFLIKKSSTKAYMLKEELIQYKKAD